MTSIAMWIALCGIGVAVAAGVARGLWMYRASLTWPTAEGSITRLDIDRRQSGQGHYFRATFSYDFRARGGELFHGTWSKDFSSEPKARDFAERELPMNKRVIVRFHPKNPANNNLELDSWTYTGDRPLDLGVSE
jgi:hypothetical protein